MRELAKIAFVNIGDIVDVNTGGVRDNVLPDELAVIESVKVKKIKLRCSTQEKKSEQKKGHPWT